MVIDIEQELERYLQYEDKSKQYTIRVSKECGERIEKLKGDSEASSSIIIRALVEFGSKSAVESKRANSDTEKSKKSDVEKLQEEVALLRKQLQVMQQVVEKLCSDLGDTPKNV